MARIRTVKPEFFSDGALGECSPTARLLFVGTFVFADDYGNLERSSKQIKAQVFPHDRLDCEPLLLDLISHGMLIEYEHAGKKYLHIKGFDKHQKIDKKSSPRHPAYEPSPSGQLSLADVSVLEGKGREGIERAGAPTAPPTQRGTRFKPDKHCPDAWRAACKEMRPDLDPDAVYGAFSDYWISKPGQYGLKLDWLATWRNWLRKETQGQRRGGNGAPTSPVPDNWWRTDEGMRMKGEELKIPAPAAGATPSDWLIYRARVLVAAGDGPWLPSEREITLFRAVQWVRSGQAVPPRPS